MRRKQSRAFTQAKRDFAHLPREENAAVEVEVEDLDDVKWNT